jgi:hypothetical protein
MGQYKSGRGNALDEWLNGFGQRDVEYVDMSSTLWSWRAAKSLGWHLARPTAQQKVAFAALDGRAGRRRSHETLKRWFLGKPRSKAVGCWTSSPSYKATPDVGVSCHAFVVQASES